MNTHTGIHDAGATPKGRRGALLALKRTPDGIVLCTGDRYLQRQRFQARLLLTTLLIAGAALALWSPWGIVAAALGALGLMLSSSVIREKRFLRIQEGSIQCLQPGAGSSVSIGQVVRIRGAHEIQGWDPRTVIHACLSDGTEMPLLFFRGTDDQLAIEACRLLGSAVDRPAGYTDQYGEYTRCGGAENNAAGNG